MASPEIKIIAVSNVFCRLMNFVNVGDVEQGHQHTYDHATLVSTGSVMVDVLDDDDTVISSKIFSAPNMVFIHKDKRHRLTALENNTVCSCIHALRDVDNDILDPAFLVEPMFTGNRGELKQYVADNHTKELRGFAVPSHYEQVPNPV
jgi:hypothetical protein